MLTDDEIRSELRAQKIPEHLIERAVLREQMTRQSMSYVRRADDPPSPETTLTTTGGDGTSYVGSWDHREKEDARLEREHVTEADKQLRALGFRAINTSQPRHAKYITPGVPDRFYFHRARGLGFAWEAKTTTGEQSAAQKDFQADMDACGWPYVLGTDQQLFSWMLQRYPLVLDEQGHLIWRGE